MLTEILNSLEIKKIIFVVVAIPLGMKCFGQSSAAIPFQNEKQSYKFISLSEAEKVIGLAAYVKDSVWKNSENILRFTTNFVAHASDKKTGQSRRLFFSYEQYLQDAAAQDVYASIKAENEKTLAITDFTETGDEGFVAKDNLGFPFIMVRKGNKIYKFKMYYIKDKNAFEKLQSLAKKVVADS